MPDASPHAWPDDWRIAGAAELSNGVGGRVWRVKLRGGGTAIVKHLSALALADRADGEAYLRWRAGRGAVRLLDRRGPLMLLEDAGTTSLLGIFQRDGDETATAVGADVLRGMLDQSSDPPPPAGLMTLREQFASLFIRCDRSSGATRDAVFRHAAQLAERLLGEDRPAVVLHGDFHHENVIRSPRGWIVIDPKGLLGDPGYEAANWFYNPVESDLRYDPARAARVATALSTQIAEPQGRLLEWAIAHAALSAAWHEEDGDEAEAGRSLAVAAAVAEALGRISA